LNSKFGVLGVALISATLVGSLYAYRYLYHPWNRKVFTFPSEVQRVVNGTAIMEVSWRWLPETLEIVAKVNDDETNTTYTTSFGDVDCSDSLCFLFDSDNNGNFTFGWHPIDWREKDDHAVCMLSRKDRCFNRTAIVYKHCWVDSNGHINSAWVYGNPPVVGFLDNSTTCTFKEDGYTFTTSIPIEFINVKHPTTVQINYLDGDCRARLEYGEPYEEAWRVLSTLVAELEM